MNSATRGMEGNASAPVLYMALELSNKTWRLALSDGAKHRQVTVAAADLMKLAEAVAQAKERFGMPAAAARFGVDRGVPAVDRPEVSAWRRFQGSLRPTRQ